MFEFMVWLFYICFIACQSVNWYISVDINTNTFSWHFVPLLFDLLPLFFITSKYHVLWAILCWLSDLEYSCWLLAIKKCYEANPQLTCDSQSSQLPRTWNKCNLDEAIVLFDNTLSHTIFLAKLRQWTLKFLFLRLAWHFNDRDLYRGRGHTFSTQS